MKKQFKSLISLFVIIALVITAAGPISDVYAATKTVRIKGKYYQSDSRKMKKMINEFRTGNDAWYYKQEGSNKKVRLDDLKSLKYDYALEKVAMRRAAEISILFDHTRPDGSGCFTAFPEGYMSLGENIAMGSSGIMSTKDTFKLWQETDKSYNGQGHRRNMLSDSFTCVGIACFEIDGNKYWVQEFGSPKSSTKKTKACNGTKTVKIKVSE